jgi:hypothetical protein
MFCINHISLLWSYEHLSLNYARFCSLIFLLLFLFPTGRDKAATTIRA